MKVSNCCNASIVEESIYVCSDCKEHCDVVEIEEDKADYRKNKANPYSGKMNFHGEDQLGMFIDTMERIL